MFTRFVALLGLSLLLFAGPAVAQTTDLQMQLAQLMKQLAELQAKTAQMGSIAANDALPPSPGCPALSRVLSKGLRGDDVKGLQGFLVAKGLLSSDSATGFFGALTEAAIKKYQCDASLTCSGSPSATGWGVVGPRTRASIMSSCRGAGTAANSPAPVRAPAAHPNGGKVVDEYDDGLPYVPRLPQKAGLTSSASGNLAEIDAALAATDANDATEIILED